MDIFVGCPRARFWIEGCHVEDFAGIVRHYHIRVGIAALAPSFKRGIRVAKFLAQFRVNPHGVAKDILDAIEIFENSPILFCHKALTSLRYVGAIPATPVMSSS